MWIASSLKITQEVQGQMTMIVPNNASFPARSPLQQRLTAFQKQLSSVTRACRPCIFSTSHMVTTLSCPLRASIFPLERVCPSNRISSEELTICQFTCPMHLQNENRQIHPRIQRTVRSLKLKCRSSFNSTRPKGVLQSRLSKS